MTSLLARLSVRSILNAVFVTLAVIVCGALLWQLNDAWQGYRQAARLEVLTTAEHDGFDAALTLRGQRVVVQGSLQDAGDAAAVVKKSRADAATGVTKAIAATAGLNTKEAAPLVAKMQADQAAAAGQWDWMEGFAAKPKGERNLHEIGGWYQAYTKILEDSVALLGVIDNEARMGDATMAELMNIRQLAWVARDWSGRECATGRTAAQHSTQLTAKEREFVQWVRGNSNAAWESLEALLKRPGIPANLVALAKKGRASDLQSWHDRDAMYAKLDNSGKELMSSAEWGHLCADRLLDIEAIIAPAITYMQGHSAAAMASAERELIVTALILFGAMAVSGAGLVLVRRRISAPVAKLSAAIGFLARRDYSQTVPKTGYEDEFGSMAETLEQLRLGGEEAERLTAEQMGQKEAEAKRAAALDAACKAFDTSIRNGLEAMNAAGGRMSNTATGMTQTAETTAKQTTVVAAASEEASTNVQTVAAAAEELAASVAEIGRQVTTSAKVAADAAEKANSTNQSVQALADAATKIGDVVKLINDIAGQTNLLALNATIEAARAGEAGKGFAVVASEVKSLATQTAKATEDIAAQIAAIQAATNGAVAAIKEIGQVIGQVNEISTTIAAAVEEQGAATQEIARNAQEAAKGTAEVSANISGVKQAADDTGKAASDVLDAAKQVASQTEQLRQEVDGFLGKIRAA